MTAAVLPFRPARSLSAPSTGPSSARVPASVVAKSPAHPALVFCTGCGAHGVRCIAPAGDLSAVTAVSCSACGLVVSLAELAHARRFEPARARLRAVAGR